MSSGHNRTGTNILVNSPVNNTEYVCVSLTNDDEVSSDPAYIIIAGNYVHTMLSLYICKLHNIRVIGYSYIATNYVCRYVATYRRA